MRKDDKNISINDAVQKSYDLLIEKLTDIEAFVVIFTLYAYKRFDDMQGGSDGSGEKINIPKEHRWASLFYPSVEEVFLKVDEALHSMSAINPALENVANALCFKNFSEKISFETQKKVLALFNGLTLSAENYSPKEVLKALPTLFELKSNSKSPYNNLDFGEFVVSPEVIRFFVKMMAPKKNEKILVPYCNTGEIIDYVIEELDDQNEGELEKASHLGSLILNEHDKGLWAITIFRVLLGEYKKVIGVYNKWLEYVEGARPSSIDGEFIRSSVYDFHSTHGIWRERFPELYNIDLVLYQHPSAIRKEKNINEWEEEVETLRFHWVNKGQGEKWSEPWLVSRQLNGINDCLERIFNYAEDQGRMTDNNRIGLILNAIHDDLFAPDSKVKELIASDTLKAAINLPKNSFFPNQFLVNPRIILLIGDNEYSTYLGYPYKEKSKMLYVDAPAKAFSVNSKSSQIEQEKILKIVDNFEGESKIHAVVNLFAAMEKPGSYTSAFYHVGRVKKEVDEVINKQNARKLKEICKVMPSVSFPDSDSDTSLYAAINACSLKSNIDDRYLTQNDFKENPFPVRDQEYEDEDFVPVEGTGTRYKLSDTIWEKCILVSLVTDSEGGIKPTICIPSAFNKKLCYSDSIVALIPDETLIDLDYLYYQLYTSLTKRQFDGTIHGLKEIVIPLLNSKDEQREYVEKQIKEREVRKDEKLKNSIVGIDEDLKKLFEKFKKAENKEDFLKETDQLIKERDGEREKLARMVEQFTHTLANALYPNSILEIATKLKQHPEFRKDALVLERAYHAELNMKIQGRLLSIKKSVNKKKFQTIIRKDRVKEEDKCNGVDVKKLVNQACILVVNRFFNEKGQVLEDRRREVTQYLGKKLAELKYSFEEEVFFQDINCLEWAARNFYEVPLTLIGAWNEVRFWEDRFSYAMILGHLGEIMLNALKYKKIDSPVWINLDFKESKFEENNLLIISGKNLIRPNEDDQHGTRKGLNGIKNDLAMLNELSDEDLNMKKIIKNNTFEVSLCYKEDLLIFIKPKFKKIKKID